MVLVGDDLINLDIALIGIVLVARRVRGDAKAGSRIRRADRIQRIGDEFRERGIQLASGDDVAGKLRSRSNRQNTARRP